MEVRPGADIGGEIAYRGRDALFVQVGYRDREEPILEKAVLVGQVFVLRLFEGFKERL